MATVLKRKGLHFASSEFAHNDPGDLEGAIDVIDHTLEAILAQICKTLT
jgi:hypothetical protein